MEGNISLVAALRVKRKEKIFTRRTGKRLFLSFRDKEDLIS